MGKIQQILNIKYSELCSHLGDLEYKRKQIQDAIDKTHKEIEILNALTPELIKCEPKETKDEEILARSSRASSDSSNASGNDGADQRS